MTGAQGGHDGSEDQPIHLCEVSALYDVSQHRVNQIFPTDSARKKQFKTPDDEFIALWSTGGARGEPNDKGQS